MKHIYLLLLTLLAFNTSYGQVVNPTGATTTFTPDFGTNINTTIDGTGLTTFPSATSDHEATSPTNSFLANEVTGSIDFDLGGTFNIDAIVFWNQNAGGPSTEAGINEVEFYASPDGVDYTLITDAPTSFLEVTVEPAPPETLMFTSISAAFIRMTVLSNHGDSGTGFAEIAFGSNGSLSVADIDSNKSIALFPNPATDFIQIKGLTTPENYSVYNSLGQEVTNGIVSDNQKIDINSLANGLYFLKLDNGNITKFLKN